MSLCARNCFCSLVRVRAACIGCLHWLSLTSIHTRLHRYVQNTDMRPNFFFFVYQSVASASCTYATSICLVRYTLCVHCLESSTRKSSSHVCRAFALEGRGIWHALSASVTQQIIGPVRARADFRYALDLPSNIPQVCLSKMYSFIQSITDSFTHLFYHLFIYAIYPSIHSLIIRIMSWLGMHSHHKYIAKLELVCVLLDPLHTAGKLLSC